MKFGIDVSRWQGCSACSPASDPIDWDKIAAQGVLFAGIRASVGDYYVDPAFAYNFDNAVRVGILPIPYYVIKFEDDRDPADQVNKYLEALDGRDTWVEAADIEVASPDGFSKTKYGQWTYYVMRDIEGATDAQQIIYTRKSFWDANMPSRFLKNFNEYGLWVADYGWYNDGMWPPDHQPNAPDFPRVPDIWEAAKVDGKAPSVVQYADNGRLPDMSAIASKEIDLNFMEDGPYAIWRLRSGIPEPNPSPIPPPSPEPDPEPDPTPDPTPTPDPDQDIIGWVPVYKNKGQA